MRVLVTGENSYAGRQFEKRILELNIDWDIEFVSVRNSKWKMKDFSKYDAIYHVAAIVHQKEKKENESLYYGINSDLTFELAVKAKTEGVKSFIFLSTIAVYGMNGKIGNGNVISKRTIESPTTFYGKSKLEAERKIEELQSLNFNVSILRIPMIYGNKCPGNYTALSKLVKRVKVFPKINNRKSLIFIDHLSDVVLYLIKNKRFGLFFVKNPEDINIQYMVKEIALNNNEKVYMSSLLGLLIKIFGNNLLVMRKVFGDLYLQDSDCQIEGFEYRKLSLKESIQLAEKDYK